MSLSSQIFLILALTAVVLGVDDMTCKSESDIRCKFLCSASNVGKCICGSDGKTYKNFCELKCSRHRLRKRIVKDHTGPCLKECTAEDFTGFKYRFIEWFDMVEKDQTPAIYKRVDYLDGQEILKIMFHILDNNDDMVLEWNELTGVAENPHEHCVAEFYRLCDINSDLQLNLNEWGNCFDLHIRMMPCDRLRAKAAAARRKGSRTYYPTCTSEGYCLPKQCDEQFCWCTSPGCKTDNRSLGAKTDQFTCDNY